MPEQILLTGQIVLSDAQDDGSRQLQIDVSTDRSYVVPLPAGSCEAIRNALVAPSVVVPGAPANGTP